MEVNISKFKKYEKVDFEIEVVTPMFMGGAEKENAEFRASSLKGVLRYWWRIANGYNYNSSKEMYKEESRIFGNTDSASCFKILIEKNQSIINKYNKSNLIQDFELGKKFTTEITIRDNNGNPIIDKETGRPKKKTIRLNILDYLAFGSIVQYNNNTKKNEFIKECIPPGTILKISFIFYDQKYKEEVLQAFWLLEKYGGLGAKSRNGFGGFKIINGANNFNGINLKDYEKYSNEPKDFLIFSKEVKKFNIGNYSSWIDALSEVGLAYRKARLSLENKHFFQERAKIGLPIIARFEKIPNAYKEGRLAKPIFLHVTKNNENKYEGSILVIPYRFNEGYNKNFWENFYKSFPNYQTQPTKT